MKPRILLYCPLNPTHPRLEAQTMQSILSLFWDAPSEIVLSRQDMPEMPDTVNKYANLTAKYNWARMLALAGNYDALLTVEADMMLPAMALERMTRVEADVVYGLYISRRAGRRVGSSRWLIFSEVGGAPGYQTVKMAETLEARQEIWGQVVESQGMGLGCTLIRRQVLERVPFRCPDPVVSCDWHFSLDLQAGGFSQAHDCGVVCGHIDGDVVLWPELEKGIWIEG